MEWFVLRDLKRRNAKRPAYVELAEAGFEVFTPMTVVTAVRNGRRVSSEVPFLQDLLFVHSGKGELDAVIRATPTLQYRYGRGNNFDRPMTVDEREMERFMAAISLVERPKYYAPGELPASAVGKRARLLMAGALDGYECTLLSVRGSRKRHILVELPGFLSAEIEVAPDLIEIL